MIRDVTELREHGQVCRRVADLEVDLDTWRAGMRRAARREGIRIRTFVVEPPPEHDDLVDGQGDDLPTDQPDLAASGPVVYAVRTDLPPDLAKMAAVMDQIAAKHLGFTAHVPACECGWTGGPQPADAPGYHSAQQEWMQHFQAVTIDVTHTPPASPP